MSNHITLHVNLLPFVLSQDVKLFCSSVIENTTFVIFFFCCWPEFCVFFSAYTLKCQRCLPDISGRCTATEKTCPSPNDQCATRRISSFAGGVFHGALCFNCQKKKKSFALAQFYWGCSFVTGDAKLSDVNLKTCVQEDECSEGSVNFGISRIVVTSLCCTTNLCNTGNAPGNSLTLSVGIEVPLSFNCCLVAWATKPVKDFKTVLPTWQW